MLYLARSRINVPRGRQFREFSRLIKTGRRSTCKLDFRRDLETLKTQQTRFGFVQGSALRY
jgi:hypothetical protein